MKVLIVGNSSDENLEASYMRAFRALNVDAKIVDPGAALRNKPAWRAKTVRRLFERRILKSFGRSYLETLCETDADMTLVFKGAFAVPEFWRQYKAARPKRILACYNADDPVANLSRGANRPWITESIPCFDLYCTYKEALLPDLLRLGAQRVVRIPFAWDPLVHPRSDTGEAGDVDVVFVGNGDAHRANWLSRIMEDPRTRNWKVVVHGKWKPSLAKKLHGIELRGQVTGADMAQAIAGAKVSLNILRLQNEGSHNMRTFEVPGAGGLLASQYSTEQDAFFPRDSGAVYFDDPKGAVSVIDALLRDRSTRDAIRQAAHSRAQQNTYEARASQILQEFAKVRG